MTALVAAAPAIQNIVKLPQPEPLTEFSVFGSYHNATYPTNITANQNYQLYFGVNNELGVVAYYQIQVKFRTEKQSAPDSFNHTNSEIPALGSVSLFAANQQTVEVPVDISFQYNLDPYNTSQMNLQSVTVNGAKLKTNDEVVFFDTARNGFFGNIFFELWIYNGTSNTFQYHERYLSLWLQFNP